MNTLSIQRTFEAGKRRLLPVIAASALACIFPLEAYPQPVAHVIHISVDGLRPDAVTALGPLLCPNFHRLMVEGAYTLNARTDCDFTNTLPNHACQMTGRAALGPDGHGVSFNSDGGGTIEDAHGSYVTGIFDVVHDFGLTTALYTGKDKFTLFDRSWDAVNGAPDTTGEDNGRDKIDNYLCLWNTSALVDSFLSLLDSTKPIYTLLHLRDPDSDSHAYGWKSAEYLDSVIRIDVAIGRVLEAVERDPVLSGTTIVIVTADHGGTGTDHSDPANPFNYTIQFHTWGPGIPAGADIYMLNPVSRLDPGTGWLPCDTAPPPVRNGEAANLASSLLGLPPVPGSTISSEQDLVVTTGVTLPSVTITSPVDGSEYGPGDPVVIEVDAFSGNDISKVEFFMDQARIGEDLSAPWSHSIDGLPLGIRVLTVRASGADGLASTDRISVLVNSTTAVGESDRTWDSRTIVRPNPVTGSSRLFFSIESAGPVSLFVYNALGRRVSSVGLGVMQKGHFGVPLRMSGLRSGVYFYSLTTPGKALTGKFIIVR